MIAYAKDRRQACRWRKPLTKQAHYALRTLASNGGGVLLCASAARARRMAGGAEGVCASNSPSGSRQPQRLVTRLQHEVCCSLDAGAVYRRAKDVEAGGGNPSRSKPRSAITAAARTNVTQAQLAEMYQLRWTSPLLCRGYAEDAVRRLEPIRRRPLVVPTAGGAEAGNRRRLPFCGS